MVEKPEDLNLPNAVISRIVKESLPAGTIVSKEARSAIARAASVFVLYATSTSVSVAQKSKKKTLSAQDVLTALNEMDFQNFVPQLEECLDAYRKSQQTKKDLKDAKKAKKADVDKSPTKEAGGDDELMESEDIANEENKENGIENGSEAPAD